MKVRNTMELHYAEHLTDPHWLEELWRLLCLYDRDFVPPLSQRESTYQQALTGGPAEDGPHAYFQALREQSFLLAAEGEALAGFFSFRQDYLPPPIAHLRQDGRLALYVTTIVVDAPARGQGLATRFYRALPTFLPGPLLITTRTWSGNRSHLHVLEKLGFSLALRIPDDRGPGVDTVYYSRACGTAADGSAPL